MKWLGCILRLGKKRMIFKAVKMLYQHRQQGDLLMDAPASRSWEDLVKQAEDEKKWRKAVREIKDTICMTMAKGGKKKKPKIGKEGAGAEAATTPSREVGAETKKEEEEERDIGSGSDDEEWEKWGLDKRK